MSDDEEDVVEVMGAQEVQAHQMRVQKRQRMEDPTKLLIASGYVRVDEVEVVNAARKNICVMCREVYSGSCFSLSVCPHFFHGPYLRPWFDEVPTDKHVMCPSCRTPHVTKCTQCQAQILADIIQKEYQSQNRGQQGRRHLVPSQRIHGQIQ